MGFYGVWETWKVVYLPKKDIMDGTRGVAFVEAGDQGHAMSVFRELYRDKFITVESIRKLSDCR